MVNIVGYVLFGCWRLLAVGFTEKEHVMAAILNISILKWVQTLTRIFIKYKIVSEIINKTEENNEIKKGKLIDVAVVTH